MSVRPAHKFVSAIFIGLAVIMATPQSGVTQTCTPAGSGTPPTVAFSGPTTPINCHTLTGGLTLTFGSDAMIGMDGSPASDDAISIDADGDGNNNIAVISSGKIYTNKRGIYVVRDGSGELRVEHKAGSIVSKGTTDNRGYGISVNHKGEANTETAGIHIISAGNIDLSGSADTGKIGIFATTKDAPAKAIIPIKIEVTGGTIDVRDSGPSSTEKGQGIQVEQFAKGNINITVGREATLGEDAEGGFIGGRGIYAELKPTSIGDITIVHQGKIYAGRRIEAINLSTSQMQGNIKIMTAEKSVIKIKPPSSSTSSSTRDGIFAFNGKSVADGGITSGTGDITVVHNGRIDSDRMGIYAVNWGLGDVTVTTGNTGVIEAEQNGILVSVRGANRPGAITIAHNGKITAKKSGIYAQLFYEPSTSSIDIRVTTGQNSDIAASTSGSSGITVNNPGTGKSIVTVHGKIKAVASGVDVENEGTGSITVTTEKGSSIVAEATGASAVAGINVSVKGTGKTNKVAITHKGEIKTDGQGISAAIHGGATDFSSSSDRDTTSTGAITIETAAGSKITAEKNGVHVWHNGGGSQAGQGTFAVTVRGMVMGDSAYKETNTVKHAGIHIQAKTSVAKGGYIVVGPRSYVHSKSDDAIRVDEFAGPVKIFLEKDRGVVGRIKGKIQNPGAANNKATLTFYTRVGASDTQLKDDGTGPVLYMWDPDAPKGIYEIASPVRLMPFADNTGYEFKAVAGVSNRRLYHNRARLYEVLPLMLLDLMESIPYSIRMAAPLVTTGEEVVIESSKGERMVTPGSGTIVWARGTASDGKRMADASTTAADLGNQSLSWDIEKTGFEAGLNIPAGDNLMLGASAHYRQADATVKAGGAMEASSAGLGLSLTYMDDSGFYVDGQLTYTRFSNIEMVETTSSTNRVIWSGGSGTGMAVEVEVGQRMTVANMTMTPRGGLSWASVDMDAFAEPVTIDGNGMVTPDKEQSVQGRVGVLAELGPEDTDRRLYASLDLEHEFSPEHEVIAAGTRLTAKIKPTWVRLGFGGSVPLGDSDTMMLAGDAFYAAAGGGNTDFGGGVALTIRF